MTSRVITVSMGVKPMYVYINNVYTYILYVYIYTHIYIFLIEYVRKTSVNSPDSPSLQDIPRPQNHERLRQAQKMDEVIKNALC